MSAHVYEAIGIVAGRTWSDQDRALVREVELNRKPRERRGWFRPKR